MSEVSRIKQVYNQVGSKIDTLKGSLKVLNTSKVSNFLLWAEWKFDDTVKLEYELEQYVQLQSILNDEIELDKTGFTKEYLDSTVKFWNTEFALFRIPASTNSMKNHMALLRLEVLAHLKTQFEVYLTHLN